MNTSISLWHIYCLIWILWLGFVQHHLVTSWHSVTSLRMKSSCVVIFTTSAAWMKFIGQSPFVLQREHKSHYLIISRKTYLFPAFSFKTAVAALVIPYMESTVCIYWFLFLRCLFSDCYQVLSKDISFHSGTVSSRSSFCLGSSESLQSLVQCWPSWRGTLLQVVLFLPKEYLRCVVTGNRCLPSCSCTHGLWIIYPCDWYQLCSSSLHWVSAMQICKSVPFFSPQTNFKYGWRKHNDIHQVGCHSYFEGIFLLTKKAWKSGW